MKKKWIVIMAVLMSLMLVVAPVSAAPDLPKEHQFYEEITYLMDNGIVTGYSNGTIQPDQAVTRAEAAIMIGRLKGFDGAKQATPFSDVPKDHTASGFIAEAAEAGLLSGYPDGTYRPDVPIVRGDVAMIVQRVFGLSITINSGFRDMPEGMKSFKAVGTLIAANITIGYPNNSFHPLENITRSQFSAFLARGMEPEFRNKATIGDSYLRDKTKVYVMEGAGEAVTYRYRKYSIRDGAPPEWVWVMERSANAAPAAIVEAETYSGYFTGPPYKDLFFDLPYRQKVGTGFLYAVYFDPFREVGRTITGFNQTVETKYKTFTDATEVTDEEGNKYYYAHGHGQIKQVNADGTVLSQLVDIR
ncbi:S-layer homology domain-containing protein [Planococcus chinensis]|uniref:S-layer homology domain-containing protein n=1 Tax=Planococcus chinensis TaxID=272917 RepID=A0ABW4QER5_9BACL